MVVLDEGAIQQAISYTQEAKNCLERNYAHMKDGTMEYLVEWKDAHVTRYAEQLEAFDSYVKNCAAQLDYIEECLRADLNFLANYNG